MLNIFDKVHRRILMWRGYGEAFSIDGFINRERLRADYQVVAAALMRHVSFTSVIDVGCANGFLLHEFVRNGKIAKGIELSPDVRKVLSPELNAIVELGDFSQATGRWDLVSCVEVAEHLPPVRSQELVQTLVLLAKSAIFFTAAPPGQSGHGHINLRPITDWLAWFREHNWLPNDTLTNSIRGDMEAITGARWLITNALVLTPDPHESSSTAST